MKKYIGTKQVEAEPMTLGDYVKKTGRNPYVNDPKVHDNSEKGYIVKYKDGYISWSPADVFEQAYKVSETTIDRMHIECGEVKERLDKLNAFLSSDNGQKLSTLARGLLSAQASIMSGYISMLEVREDVMEEHLQLFNQFNFGAAIELLKAGLCVRRWNWGQHGPFIIKQVPAHIGNDVVPKMQSLPQSAKDLIMANTGFIDYTSQCLIYDPNIGKADSWMPSIDDVFADDWQIIM